MGSPMRCDMDLDWSTYTCPCGESLCTRYLEPEEVGRWLARHKSHTDGKCLEHTTADGNRAWATPAPDEMVDL